MPDTLRPADFLVKPIGYERFAKMLEAALKENKRSSTFLEYTLENTRHRIRTSEVLFLKAYGKKVAFHTRDGSFTVYGKIRDLIAGCEDQFLCISRGEYANIRHVLSAAPREVRLTDNHILHISRGRAGAVSQRLAEL